jgi:hypothetical protein
MSDPRLALPADLSRVLDTRTRVERYLDELLDEDLPFDPDDPRWSRWNSPFLGRYTIRCSALVILLRRGHAMTIPEIQRAIEASGRTFGSRVPNRALADALAWDVKKGRVRRVSRGVYVAHRVPPSTARRLLQQLPDMR